MPDNIIIRDDINKYMADLRAWLGTVRDVPFEGMAEFFAARISDYEQHMSVWEKAYRFMPSLIPSRAKNILDLGCGTGLELDSLLPAHPELEVTGIDMCETMLSRLAAKHPEVKLIRADYFEYDFGTEVYDAIISFESLHHFKPIKKLELFCKLNRALIPGGIFINADYIACCDEEETLRMNFCEEKRKREGIPDGTFIHFDTPLTAEHECSLLTTAGFARATLTASIDGASLIIAKKSFSDGSLPDKVI